MARAAPRTRTPTITTTTAASATAPPSIARPTEGTTKSAQGSVGEVVPDVLRLALQNGKDSRVPTQQQNDFLIFAAVIAVRETIFYLARREPTSGSAADAFLADPKNCALRRGGN